MVGMVELRVLGNDDFGLYGGYIGKGGMAEIYKINPNLVHKLSEIKTIFQLGLSDFTCYYQALLDIKGGSLLYDFDKEIKLNEVHFKKIERSLYEQKILNAVSGNRNTVISRGHHLVLKPYGNYKKLFFVQEMNYLEGKSLLNIFESKEDNSRYSIRQAAKTIADIAEAIYDAHQQNIVHQDIKPANVIFSPGYELGNATLIDFGVSNFLGENIDKGITKGTLGYVSPEQLQGIAVKEIDYFALGLLAFKVFMGGEKNLIDKKVEACNKNGNPMPYLKFMIMDYNSEIRGIMMDDLRQATKKRFGNKLPSKLEESIEAMLESNYKERTGLEDLRKESLKLALDTIYTEEFPPLEPQTLDTSDLGTEDIMNVTDDYFCLEENDIIKRKTTWIRDSGIIFEQPVVE